MLCACGACHAGVAIPRGHTALRILPQDRASDPQHRHGRPELLPAPVAKGVVAAGAGGVAVPAAFCILTPASWACQDRAWLHEHVVSERSDCVVPRLDEPYPPSVVPNETVTHVVEEPTWVPMQSRALSKHATRVVVYEGYYALSNHIA